MDTVTICIDLTWGCSHCIVRSQAIVRETVAYCFCLMETGAIPVNGPRFLISSRFTRFLKIPFALVRREIPCRVKAFCSHSWDGWSKSKAEYSNTTAFLLLCKSSHSLITCRWNMSEKGGQTRERKKKSFFRASREAVNFTLFIRCL